MERIGEEVERALARTGSREAVPLAAITAAWPSAVGPSIARNAWPRRLGRDGTLHVATSSSTWAHELSLLSAGILDQLRARLGEQAPLGLRFAIGAIPEPAVPDTKPAAPMSTTEEVPPEIAAAAAAAASATDDPELRELVSRAARASLLRARSGRRF